VKLTEGLLWCDAGKPIEQMVLEAADAYQHKHGVRPNCALVYRELADDAFYVGGIACLPTYRLKHHLLIGVAND